MKPLLLSLLSGLLFAFSLPPFNWEWLGWVAFVPLLAGVPGRRPLEAVGLGMLAGVTCGAVQAGWYHDTARLLWAYIPFLWLVLPVRGGRAGRFPDARAVEPGRARFVRGERGRRGRMGDVVSAPAAQR